MYVVLHTSIMKANRNLKCLKWTNTEFLHSVDQADSAFTLDLFTGKRIHEMRVSFLVATCLASRL